jgi:hypothetical protein
MAACGCTGVIAVGFGIVSRASLSQWSPCYPALEVVGGRAKPGHDTEAGRDTQERTGRDMVEPTGRNTEVRTAAHFP